MNDVLPEVAPAVAATPAGVTSAPAKPDVLVMNPYYSGLGIARSLRGRGVRVVALCAERGTPGARSRHFDAVVEVPNGRDDPDGLVAALQAIAGGFATRPILFPTRDFDLLFIERYRAALEPCCVLPAGGEPLVRLMDKLELARGAAAIGIDTPATAACASLADLAQCIEEMRFPLVVKPRFAYQWRGAGAWQRVGAQKAHIVADAAALRALYEQLATVTPELLVQEFIPGDDHDIVVCCCYVDRAGVCRGQFTARKLRQNPPLVGTGSVVEALPVERIVEPTVALLRAFGYAGIAEVEFKYDRALDRYALIEVNPRHWDQHELGTLVGINITWLAYAELAGLAQGTDAPAYAAGTRYKWIAETELMRTFAGSLWTACGGRREAAAPSRRRAIAHAFADLRDLVAGRRILGMSRFDDPVPGLLSAAGEVRQLARAAAARLRRRFALQRSHSS